MGLGGGEGGRNLEVTHIFFDETTEPRDAGVGYEPTQACKAHLYSAMSHIKARFPGLWNKGELTMALDWEGPVGWPRDSVARQKAERILEIILSGKWPGYLR